MKKHHQLLLIAITAILLFDIIGSKTSYQFNFPYAYFAPISLIISTTTSFFITKAATRKAGIRAAMVLGLFDATIGFKISRLLKANNGGVGDDMNLVVALMIVIMMLLIGFLLGLLGAWLSEKFYPKNTICGGLDHQLQSQKKLLWAKRSDPV